MFYIIFNLTIIKTSGRIGGGYLFIFRRLVRIMSKVVALNQSFGIKKSHSRKSPYSTFIIKRNNYSKIGEKSLVGTTIIERPSWSDKEDGKQEE